MLTKYSIPGVEPFTLAMSVNGLLIKKRLVWMAYYLVFEDKETINRLEEKSDLIVKQLLATD